MIVRQATLSEFKRLAALRWDFKIEDGETISSPREVFESKFIEHLNLERDLWTHFVSEDGSDIVGMVSICRAPKLLSPDMKGDCIGYLTNTFVVPSRRNQGVGENLLKAAVVWAKENNFELLFVWPSDRSRELYSRVGFKTENDIMELLLV